MVDRYLWGRVERISPEAPVPVVEIERESDSLGGAGNVAANLSALGAVPGLVAVVGDDDAAQRLRRQLAERGVSDAALVVDAARPTTVKTRIIAHSQQVVRADREARGDVNGPLLDRLGGAIDRVLADAEALVVSDYGKGVVHPGSLERALTQAAKHGIPVCVDPKESHIDSYRGVTVLTPNQLEAGYVQGRRVIDEESLLDVGWGLQKRLDARGGARHARARRHEPVRARRASYAPADGRARGLRRHRRRRHGSGRGGVGARRRRRPRHRVPCSPTTPPAS